MGVWSDVHDVPDSDGTCSGEGVDSVSEQIRADVRCLCHFDAPAWTTERSFYK